MDNMKDKKGNKESKKATIMIIPMGIGGQISDIELEKRHHSCMCDIEEDPAMKAFDMGVDNSIPLGRDYV